MNYLLWFARKGEENIKMELSLVREISQGPFGELLITGTAIHFGNYEAPTVCYAVIGP